MTLAHTLGYPRIGTGRELKKATEAYWKGEIEQSALEACGRELRARHWQAQRDAGLDLVTVGDFAFYDQVLNVTTLLGAVPERFGPVPDEIDLDTYFRMARGRAPSGEPAAACEMTKYFDTNYHYLVPELHAGQTFRLASRRLFDEVEEARAAGHAVKVTLLGPLSWLWLGKVKGDATLDRLSLLDRVLPVYGEILAALAEQGVEWVQLDEPALVQDLPREWQQAYESAYNALQSVPVKLLLATYFGGLGDNLQLAVSLPVEGLHIDAVRAPQQLETVLDRLPAYKVLSVGPIDGRNVWRADLARWRETLASVHARLGERLWIAPNCSLLHVPLDVELETELDAELKSWLAFARQKLDEVVSLARLLDGRATPDDEARLQVARRVVEARRESSRIHRQAVADRLASIAPADIQRTPYAARARAQRRTLDLPLFPTTTIGSFPQTAEIRASRRAFKTGELSREAYEARMREEIGYAVKRQEALGLDMLVHGEPERNDMVEYFGELMDGFAFTRSGWVQSYGSRCVKPPLIYGDVSRPEAMTVRWSEYAQSLTERPMKGMLTGPVTILQWSFVRDDQPRETTCRQIALALRDEVADLEAAGIRAIQIDEPALREGLPLRRGAWQAYLDWAVACFRLTAGAARDETQIHTHMCYSEFNDIIASIAALDADVITIETSRSDMELLDAFQAFDYPNEIGPGVYDIHSPNIPDTQWMVQLIEKAAERIPAERLWVNPDCGLKTRSWEEVEPALANMVDAARILRRQLG